MAKRIPFSRNSPPLAVPHPVPSGRKRKQVEPHRGYGHFFFQPAEALFNNILSLRKAFQERRLAVLTIAQRSRPLDEHRRQLSQFFSNYVTRNCCRSPRVTIQIVAWARVIGRNRGAIHWHCLLVTKDPLTPSRERLRELRKQLTAGGAAFGRIHIAEVGHLGATARYLADHVERGLRARSALRRQSRPSPPELRLRLYDYSRRFPKLMLPRERSSHPWTEAFRSAAAELYDEQGHKGKPPAIWMFKNAALVRQRIGCILKRQGKSPVWQVLAPCDMDPSHSRSNRKPVESRGKLAIWDVFRYADAEKFRGAPAYMLMRKALGADRFLVSDPLGKRGVKYRKIAIPLSKADLLHLLRVQPRFGPLSNWLRPLALI